MTRARRIGLLLLVCAACGGVERAGQSSVPAAKSGGVAGRDVAAPRAAAPAAPAVTAHSGGASAVPVPPKAAGGAAGAVAASGASGAKTPAASASPAPMDAGVSQRMDAVRPVPDAGVESAAVDSGAPERGFSWRLLYTEHLGQLSGPTPDFLAPLAMTGTDLGISFPRGEELLFLFGDTWSNNPDNVDVDSVARVSASPRPTGLPALRWLTRQDGQFLPLTVPPEPLRGMSTPVEGLQVGEQSYVFFCSDWSESEQRHHASLLAHTPVGAPDAFDRLELDHRVASDKFVNLSLVREGDSVWIWGSGPYRKSPVYLASVALRDLADRAQWRYYQGEAVSGPMFGADESSALPVVQADCVGELSVRKHPRLERYLMTYNCGAPTRGIHLRTAESASGPWSSPLVIYEPAQGYEHFIHAQQSAVGHDDGLSERGREETWGGEYGPYLIPAWFADPSPGVHELVYTMSSWNPYAVQLMRSVLVEPSAGELEVPQPGAALPRARLQNPTFQGALEGWTVEGDRFSVFDDNGVATVTSFTPDGRDAVKGRMWQELQIDALTSTLRFQVHGGHGVVALYVDGRAVRRTRGRDTNDTRMPVVWHLESLRGKTVRLSIEDDLAESWGFISVGGLELR